MDSVSEPKVALVTTTINVPQLLLLLREYGPDVAFFVVGDRKTPIEVEAFCNNIPNCTYISPSAQHQWACSEPIGWNCVQRRSIGLFHALRSGADSIIYWDDDNAPIDPSYFDQFIAKLHYRFSGPCIQSFNTWFDPGALLVPPAKHRGFPIDVKAFWSVKSVVNAKIGVCAGMCLGDPDIDAVTRIATAPIVHGVSELARSGVAVDPHTTTVFNSQNTAFVRELAPLMFMWPHCGRYDDIFASLVVQRFMRDSGHHLHFGPPFIWHDRNPHNLVSDLKAELLGMEHVQQLAEWLESYAVGGRSPLKYLRDFCIDVRGESGLSWFPTRALDAGLAWCDDVERVMT